MLFFAAPHPLFKVTCIPSTFTNCSSCTLHISNKKTWSTRWNASSVSLLFKPWPGYLYTGVPQFTLTVPLHVWVKNWVTGLGDGVLSHTRYISIRVTSSGIGYRNETVWSRVGLDLPEKWSVHWWFSLEQGSLMENETRRWLYKTLLYLAYGGLPLW